MTKQRWRLVAAVLLPFALVAAACGDDDDDDGASDGAGPPIEFKSLDAGGPLTTAALESGEIQLAVMFSSQGIIADKGWVVLDDDKNLQPVDNLVAVIRTDTTNDDIEQLLNDLMAGLTTTELSALNLQVDKDAMDPSDVARGYLEEQGLLEPTVELSGSITVGSTNFSEQEIVASMVAQILEANGMDVTTKFQLGSREVVAPALENGDIDVYIEYVGTYLAVTFGGEPTGDLAATTAALRSAAEAKGITVLEPSPADDINAIVVTQETADKYGLSKISDLAGVSDQLVLGGPPECPERPFCMVGLKEVYGLEFTV